MVVSPELALVDPDLRREAIAELVRSVPRYVVARTVVAASVPQATLEPAVTRPRASELLVGALVYLLATAAQAVVFGALLLVGVAILVLVANVL